MKKNMFLACSLVLMMFASFDSYSQVYKTAEDTVKLNKEFTEVSNDIANLTAKLTVTQNNMPGYQAKANVAESDAKDAAASSSVQANKATGNSVKESRKAKREAKKAYRKAKDSKSANHDVGNQDDKIASLTKELAKKQERLEELKAMRAAIYAKIPGQ